MQARHIVNSRTDNLKKVTFVVMAILFFVNLSLMEKENWAQRTDLGFREARINQDWRAGTNFVSKADEIEFLRKTATKLQATQNDLLEEIDRLESRIRTFEAQGASPVDDRFAEPVVPGSEGQ